MIEKISELKEKARHIRNQVLDMCTAAGTGHVTSAFSCTEIMAALFYDADLNASINILAEGHSVLACGVEALASTMKQELLIRNPAMV